jgi:agmatinase
MSDFGGAIQNSQEYEFALFGVPYDAKSSFLKGAAHGPDAIRKASTSRVINSWTELGVDLEKDTTVVDLGDVGTSGDYTEVGSRIKEKIDQVLTKKGIPVVLGGDHSISFPAVEAVSRKYTSLDILHFDAHPDLYDELYGDRYSHACPFTRILEAGLVENLVQLGVRAVTGDHLKKAEQYGVKMHTMRDLAVLPKLKFSNPVYVSFDMDVLDPAFAPGVSHHEPGGLSTRQVIQMIHTLEASIVGMDVVEVNPIQDKQGITADAAVKIIMEMIGKIVFDRKLNSD